MADEKDPYQLTFKHLGLAMAGLIAFSSALSSGLNYLFPFRHDPFTGTQGDALTERVSALEHWRNDHVVWGRENNGRTRAQIEELYRICGD